MAEAALLAEQRLGGADVGNDDILQPVGQPADAVEAYPLFAGEQLRFRLQFRRQEGGARLNQQGRQIDAAVAEVAEIGSKRRFREQIHPEHPQQPAWLPARAT